MTDIQIETIKREELRVERARYDNLVQGEVNSVNFDVYFHKKVQYFIYITIILGGIFTWSSSGNGSNIYLLLDCIVSFLKKYEPKMTREVFLNLCVLFLLLLPLLSFVVSGKNIRKQLKLEEMLTSAYQHKVFKCYIKSLIENREQRMFSTMTEIFEFIKGKDVYDIEITTLEFENYLKNKYESDKLPVHTNFISNYANLILLNECIERTLVIRKLGEDSQFTLILSKNYEII